MSAERPIGTGDSSADRGRDQACQEVLEEVAAEFTDRSRVRPGETDESMGEKIAYEEAARRVREMEAPPPATLDPSREEGERCSHCGGHGATVGNDGTSHGVLLDKPCSTCGGSGEIYIGSGGGYGSPGSSYMPCPGCPACRSKQPAHPSGEQGEEGALQQALGFCLGSMGEYGEGTPEFGAYKNVHTFIARLAATPATDTSKEVEQRPECAECEGGGQTPDPTVSDGWLECEACGGFGLTKGMRDA